MAELMRVSIRGQNPGGEVWSVNPVYSIGGDFGVPVSAVQAQTIATAIAAISVPTALKNSISASSNVTGARVEARSLAGTLEAQAEGVKATPEAGTGSGVHQHQSALVISLRTATPGPRGRGRLYWNASGQATVVADLRVSSANMVLFVAGAKTYLSAIEAAIAATLTGVSLAVWSRKSNDLFPVTGIQAGNVLDVQRRRRDALIESITSLTYP